MNMGFHLATWLRLVTLAYLSTSESLFTLVDWPQPNCHKQTILPSYMLQCNEASTWQLSNFWQLDLGQPPTINSAQTKYMQLATRFWVWIRLQPNFFIRMFNLGLANGAKVGLKLRAKSDQLDIICSTIVKQWKCVGRKQICWISMII